jgi:CoA:oxalate CoA-transferase
MKVDVAMLDCQVAILENAIARYTATGEVPGPLGARHPSITPFDAFATEDGYIIIAAGNNVLFAKLCNAVGRDDLPANPLFAENDLRSTHHVALKHELETALKARTTGEWLASLETAGVPCGPINTVDQVLADPHVLARNMLVSVDDPAAGSVRMAGNPIKLSAFVDPSVRPPAPDLDADRAAVVGEFVASA